MVVECVSDVWTCVDVGVVVDVWLGESKKTDMDSSLDGFPGTRYVFLGLFALMDPPRAEVPDAIKQAQQAGRETYNTTQSCIWVDHLIF